MAGAQAVSHFKNCSKSSVTFIEQSKPQTPPKLTCQPWEKKRMVYSHGMRQKFTWLSATFAQHRQFLFQLFEVQVVAYETRILEIYSFNGLASKMKTLRCMP